MECAETVEVRVAKIVNNKAKTAIKCLKKYKNFYSKVWENTTSRIKNSITGCSAVGSAPALGAGCRRFESCHSDHLSWKSRLLRRFFCVNSSFFEVYLAAFYCGKRGKKSA